MSFTGMNVGEAQLPVARTPEKLLDPLKVERARNYSIFRIVLPDFSTGFLERITKPIKTSGDHLTVLSIEGPHEVGIAINRGNQYLPIEEGTVITREIVELSVKAFVGIQPSGGLGLPTIFEVAFGSFVEVTFAVSWGPLLTFPPRHVPGLRGQFPMGRGTATANGVRILDIFRGPSHNWPVQILKRGGTLLIRNLDLAATLYLYHGVGGDFNLANPGAGGLTGAWEIGPREVLTLEARSRLSQRFRFDGTLGLTLCLATSGGNVLYNVIASNWGDSSDPDSRTDVTGDTFITSREYGRP